MLSIKSRKPNASKINQVYSIIELIIIIVTNFLTNKINPSY